MLLMDSNLVVFCNGSCWIHLGHVTNVCFCGDDVGGGDCGVCYVDDDDDDGGVDFFHLLSSCDRLVAIG